MHAPRHPKTYDSSDAKAIQAVQLCTASGLGMLPASRVRRRTCRAHGFDNFIVMIRSSAEEAGHREASSNESPMKRKVGGEVIAEPICTRSKPRKLHWPSLGVN
jgi:hypothetical protein